MLSSLSVGCQGEACGKFKDLIELGKKVPSIYEISAVNIEKKEVSLSPVKGKVLLVVNVASKCGFTPQYEELEQLYQRFGARGFEILGFPCNQFAGQESGSEEEIKNFCSTKYNISFPLFQKVEVNGSNTHPLFALLKHKAPGLLGTEAIKWNFTKFLVSKDGEKVQRFAPTIRPLQLAEIIESLLSE